MTVERFKNKVMAWVGADKHLLLLDDSKPDTKVKKELQVLDEVQDFLKKIRDDEDIVESTLALNVHEWTAKRIKEITGKRMDKQGVQLGKLNNAERDQLLLLLGLKELLRT